MLFSYFINVVSIDFGILKKTGRAIGTTFYIAVSAVLIAFFLILLTFLLFLLPLLFSFAFFLFLYFLYLFLLFLYFIWFVCLSKYLFNITHLYPVYKYWIINIYCRLVRLYLAGFCFFIHFFITTILFGLLFYFICLFFWL